MESSSTTDRKTIEKNRRNQMKALFSKLNSLIPHQRSGEGASLPDQLDDAVNYIKQLQTNLEKMREKKDRLMGGIETGGSPLVEIHETGSALQVQMITGLEDQFMFNESIRVLHEEGADVVNAGFSVVEDTVFHTIHSKIEELAPGCAAARISERLNKKFVNDALGSI